MTNFTGANVITASDVTKYQPDVFEFGIASGSTEATNYFAQTTNDILRQLRIEWFPTYKTNVYTDITVTKTDLKEWVNIIWLNITKSLEQYLKMVLNMTLQQMAL